MNARDYVFFAAGVYIGVGMVYAGILELKIRNWYKNRK